MKSKVLTLLILSFIILTHFSQIYCQEFCRTNTTLIPTFPPATTSSFDDGPSVPINMKIYIFVIRRTDKSGGWLPNEAVEAYNILKQDFSSTQIDFNWDGCIKYIDDDALYTEEGREIDVIYSPPLYQTTSNGYVQVIYEDGISIFLFPKDHPFGGGFSDAKIRCLVSGTLYNQSIALSHVISHEVAHCFGLHHTHGDCWLNGYEPTNDPIACNYTGDYICDTPADPGLISHVNENCQWDGEGHCDELPEPITNYHPHTNNYMSYTRPNCMSNFTNGQIERMWLFITTADWLTPRNFGGTNPPPIDQCSCSAEDIVISENKTITSDLYLTGDLKIISGAHLTIQNCSVFFKSGKGIKLYENSKLTVDKGVLTACENELWTGIQVAGGNDDYDVKIINQSSIENTSSAAVSMFAPYNWPQANQFGNGILHAENSKFVKTRRMAEFMAWTQSKNTSYIKNCEQIGGKWGVTNWNCEDIKIENCTFSGVSHYGIVLVDGNVIATGNTFNCGQEDVLLNHTISSSSSILSSNYFLGQNNGIKSRGSSESTNFILNNLFQNGGFDIFNDGVNSNLVQENSFTSLFGALNIDCGNVPNEFSLNEFTGNAAGLILSGNNDGSNFFQNCFTTTFSDTYIEGSVSDPISNVEFAADNCFTHQGNNAIPVNDISGAPSNLRYLVPDDAILDCRDMLNTQVNTAPATSIGIPSCGSSLTSNPVATNYCFPKKNFKDVWDAYIWLKNKINEINNNPNLTQKQKELLKKIYLRCYERVKAMLFEFYIKDKNYIKARELYHTDTTITAKVLVYSSYIHENDLSSARTYLNNLTPIDDELTDFIAIQNINLNRIPFGPYYQPASEELELVRQIANTGTPLSGYAKSLYFVLTGEIINSPLPEFIQERFDFRTKTILNETIGVYPNPFSQNLTIDLGKNENIFIKISDFFGQNKYNNKISNAIENISTSDWDRGIYILRAYDGDKLIQTSKLVLIK